MGPCEQGMSPSDSVKFSERLPWLSDG